MLRRDLSEGQQIAQSLPSSVTCANDWYSPFDEIPSNYELRQDLQRWADDYSAAIESLDSWEREHPGDFAVPQRRGEIAYLQGDFPTAVHQFRVAWELVLNQIAPGDDWPVFDTLVSNDFDAVQPQIAVPLQLAAAQVSADDHEGALETLHVAQQTLGTSNGEARGIEEEDAEWFYVLSQLGSWHLDMGNYAEAAAYYEESLRHGALDAAVLAEYPMVISHSNDSGLRLLRGAQENNLALSLSQLERHDEAMAAAASALSRDTSNPIYLDTLAYTLHRAEDMPEAVDVYVRVLAEDPTSYVSANNLAVILAQQGELSEAADLLNAAVVSHPDYAIAWHNLGIVTSRMSVSSFVTSEQAFAKAARIDRSLRGEPQNLKFDDEIYQSGLDISKPLAPDWSFTTSASAPNRFTWTMVGLLALQVMRLIGLEQLTTGLLGKFSRPRSPLSSHRLRRWLGLPVVISLAITAVVLGILAAANAGSWIRATVYVTAAAAVVLAPWGIRALFGKDRIIHAGSMPAAGVGLLGLTLGLSIAPMPGVRPVPGKQAPSWILWTAAGLVGILIAVFGALALVTGSPTARFTATSATALLAAMMLPFVPFDGAWQQNKKVGVLIVTALALLSLVFGLRLI